MKFKLVYIVHGLILFALIASIITVLSEFKQIHEVDLLNGKDYSFNAVFQTIKTHSLFLMPLIFILPAIGVFVKNNIGWILITSYLYFLIASNIVASYLELKNNQPIELLFVVFGLLLTLVLILIMNRTSVAQDYYKIQKKKMIQINIVCFIIGLLIGITMVIKNSKYLFDTIPILAPS